MLMHCTVPMTPNKMMTQSTIFQHILWLQFLENSCERWLYCGCLRDPVHQCQHVTSTAEMLKYQVTYSNYYHFHVSIEHFLLLLQWSATLAVPFPAVRSAPCWQFIKLLKWERAHFDHDLQMTLPLLPLFIKTLLRQKRHCWRAF